MISWTECWGRLRPVRKAARKFWYTTAGTAVVAVAMAWGVWFLVHGAISYSADYTVPLNVSVPEGWIVVRQSLKELKLVVQGSENDISALTQDMIKVRAVLDPEKGAHQTILLAERHVTCPYRVRVDAASLPAQEVEVDIERKVTKAVPIRVATQGKVPVGYEPRLTTEPMAMTVTGPESELENLTEVLTVPVNVDGMTESFRRPNCPLSRPPEGKLRQYERESVALQADIVKATNVKRYEHLPVRLLVPSGQAVRAELEPESCAVAVEGNPSLLQELTADGVRLFVEPSTFVPGGEPVLREVLVSVPNGLACKVEPKQVRVRMLPAGGR